MTRQEFIDWAISKGWKMDRFGHLQKTFCPGIVKNGEHNSAGIKYLPIQTLPDSSSSRSENFLGMGSPSLGVFL